MTGRAGPNVVVKGPPYMPAVSGETACSDIVDATCQPFGNCTSCSTFNEADVDNLKRRGWNVIRLGVVWAGAQPRDEGALDPDFVSLNAGLMSTNGAASRSDEPAVGAGEAAACGAGSDGPHGDPRRAG